MIEYTPEQKVQMFDQILANARKGDQREIIRDLEQIGWKVPDEVRSEVDAYDRAAQGLPPEPHQQYGPTLDQNQQMAQAHAYREALMRQTQGANYNNPQIIEASKQVKTKLEELDKIKSELLETKEKLTKDLGGVKNTILADRYNTRIQHEVAELKDKMPGLKHLDDEALIETVKQAKASYYQDKKEMLETEDILKEIHNQQAKHINSYIEDDAKKLKLFEDEEELEEIKDTDGNVVGTLNEEGKLVKTLTKADTVGDKVKSEPEKKPVIDMTGEKQQEILKDGTIRINDDVDPNQLVNAIESARPALKSDEQGKIADIIKQDFEAQAASEGDGDGTATADS